MSNSIHVKIPIKMSNSERENIVRMNVKEHDPSDTELARAFTIHDYAKACDGQPPDQHAIADAIYRRFTDRYITPVSGSSRHGFTIMAVSCLMIEALESFRLGWDNSDGKSRAAFCFFFDVAEPFRAFRGHAQPFYTHVRCGILHQAETTGGWRIRRDDSPLFDASALTINADRFLEGLKEVLETRCEQLKTANWSGPEWTNVHKKLNAIARNCLPGG